MAEELVYNPYPVILPQSLVLGQLVASLGSFIKGTAWEIGERLDAILAHGHGPGWLSELSSDHRLPSLHDPDFIFNWHPQESILWEALPPFSIDLQKRFGKVRWTRNRWEHDAANQSIPAYLNGIDQVKRLTVALGLTTTSYAPLLVERTSVLQRAGGVLPPTGIELEIQQQKEAAEEARKAAENALAVAVAAAAQAEELGAQAAAALKAKKEAIQQVAEVKAEIERLEGELLKAGSISRQSLLEPADELQSGDFWGDLPLGVRTLTLKANMLDLMDRTTETLLSQQLGLVATEAAQRWLKIMPSGGQVHLTPAGHAAGLVGNRFVYLGRLDTC